MASAISLRTGRSLRQYRPLRPLFKADQSEHGLSRLTTFESRRIYHRVTIRECAGARTGRPAKNQALIFGGRIGSGLGPTNVAATEGETTALVITLVPVMKLGTNERRP